MCIIMYVCIIHINYIFVPKCVCVVICLLFNQFVALTRITMCVAQIYKYSLCRHEFIIPFYAKMS